MITKIEINNFRSIINASLELQGLTTIVGANATGKSNLIKAIDFISDVATLGLQEAVYKRGGFGDIFPKQFDNIYNKEVFFKIDFELEPPKNWRKYHLGSLTASYQLGFLKPDKESSIRITREELNVRSILLSSYFLGGDYEIDPRKKLEISPSILAQYANSEISIFRNTRHDIKYKLNFKLTPKNKLLFIDWLGVKDFFGESKKINLAKGKNDVLVALLNSHEKAVSKEVLPILSNRRALLGLNLHINSILTEVQSYGRYDLLLNELRKEQPISSDNQVSISGDNIPSIVKIFQKNNKEGWKRILRTMSNISPYFLSADSTSLRAGREYLIFKEIFEGRSIEAWEASDGILRAFAILLSIETHKSGSTVLIEEPEHGLHPWAVKELINHLREVIELKKLQVILTTHSQQVLESIYKDELLITERNENGTIYKTIDNIIPDSEVSMGEIGELWTRGLLMGVPRTL